MIILLIENGVLREALHLPSCKIINPALLAADENVAVDQAEKALRYGEVA